MELTSSKLTDGRMPRTFRRTCETEKARRTRGNRSPGFFHSEGSSQSQRALQPMR